MLEEICQQHTVLVQVQVEYRQRHLLSYWDDPVFGCIFELGENQITQKTETINLDLMRNNKNKVNIEDRLKIARRTVYALLGPRRVVFPQYNIQYCPHLE
jgi:hypothetical protein